MRFKVLTLSDRSHAGLCADRSGPLLRRLLEKGLEGGECREAMVLPDDRNQISFTLAAWCDSGDCDLIVTTGGTGLAFRDVTPEATREILEREIPGMAEAIRSAGLEKTPHAMLSRGICGTRGRTLVVNLPGSPPAVEDSMEILLPAIRHALDLLAGESGRCQPEPG